MQKEIIKKMEKYVESAINGNNVVDAEEFFYSLDYNTRINFAFDLLKKAYEYKIQVADFVNKFAITKLQDELNDIVEDISS